MRDSFFRQSTYLSPAPAPPGAAGPEKARGILNSHRQMSTFRIALANIRFPPTPDESVALAARAIAEASCEQAGIICFPECYVPGYRAVEKRVPPPDPAFLE